MVNEMRGGRGGGESMRSKPGSLNKVQNIKFKLAKFGAVIRLGFKSEPCLVSDVFLDFCMLHYYIFGR
jgi:hypothetical protein